MKHIRYITLVPIIALLVMAFTRPALALPAEAGAPAKNVIFTDFSPAQGAQVSYSGSVSVSVPAPLLTATITATVTVTPTVTITPTVTVTPTSTSTATPTATSTPPPTPTATPQPFAFLPVLIRQEPLPIPTEKVLYCASLQNAVEIPDNQPSGVASQLAINDPRLIHDLEVTLDINHPWVSDLSAYLTHSETGRTIRLFDQPGVPADPNGCSGDNVKAFLDDEVSATVESQCSPGSPYSTAAISGIFLPDEPLASFDGEGISGVWNLTLVDSSHGDAGNLESWCLAGTVGGQVPPPTPEPPPPVLPPSSRARNIFGQDQNLNLDCESRVAVDWAAHFGVFIGEYEFFNRLPASDNPDTGFVGDVNGAWGQTPPDDYGVHADPVAALLREYGLPAYAHKNLSWDALRAELAARRPVYVWVIGSVHAGIPKYYRARDGLLSLVARYEHTVQVIGYSETSVRIRDGSSEYTRSIAEFLSSWSALGNMAITAQP